MTLVPAPSPSLIDAPVTAEDVFLVRVVIPLTLVALVVLIAIIKPPRPGPS